MAGKKTAPDLLVKREKRRRLARELRKLDVAEEQRLAEEGLGEKWAEFVDPTDDGLRSSVVR